MDIMKTPSVQSLLDSDLESVGSLQYLDIEELDEVEYALPVSEAPTLEDVLIAEESDEREVKKPIIIDELTICSALQVDFLQGVSQQLIQAQNRSSTGAGTALGVGADSKLTIGTAHGHLLSFLEQTLKWVCDSNVDCGAVSCLSYNSDSTRLLAGYARGLICQYESERGVILRRVTLVGEIWGILNISWAGTSGLALDTGGSVWLIKFSRLLGVRSARSSCLFSGARGEVVAMRARDARVLALASLSRVIVVAGGRAAGVRLAGSAQTLPVLEWSEHNEGILVCARDKTLKWLSVKITGSSIALRPIRNVDLVYSPLWLGWLGGALAIFDSNENLRLWNEDYEKPLDLSHIEPVYATAFFKGLWTDGRVSQAMCSAGVSALGGACVADGALSLLGRRGVIRVKPRDFLARARAYIASGRYLQALRLLCSVQNEDACALANDFIQNLSDRPHLLSDKQLSDQVVKLCLKHGLCEELWSTLWDQCSEEKSFVEAIGDAIVRDDFCNTPPSPNETQALIEKLADFEPSLVERVVASLPLTSLDPHRASVFTRERGLWRAVGAIAHALGGWAGTVRALAPHVRAGCGAAGACSCAGGALLLAAADALAGRGAGGRALAPHTRPSASHTALQALLADATDDGRSALRVLVEHDAAATVRLLEQSAHSPPFAGPLAKQNRLRAARALLPPPPEPAARLDVLEFLAAQLGAGALPPDPALQVAALRAAAEAPGERAERAWLALAAARASPERLAAARAEAPDRPGLLWRLDALLLHHEDAVRQFLRLEAPSDRDRDDLLQHLRAHPAAAACAVRDHLPALLVLSPRAAAALLPEPPPEPSALAAAIVSVPPEVGLEFGAGLLEAGRLRGAAALAHVRLLCALRPGDAADVLRAHAGLVRPEDALAAARGAGAAEAEAVCLEAAGDLLGALDALLQLAAELRGGGEGARLVERACELCARVAPALREAEAGELWRRAARAGGPLLEAAAAHLPAVEVAAHCGSAAAARSLATEAGRRAALWTALAAVTRREAHTRVARALGKAQRGRAARGACAACGGPLAGGVAVVAAHCARAFHAQCSVESCCGACGRALSAAGAMWVAGGGARPPPAHWEHALQLAAPPRPDLEGQV